MIYLYIYTRIYIQPFWKLLLCGFMFGSVVQAIHSILTLMHHQFSILGTMDPSTYYISCLVWNHPVYQHTHIHIYIIYQNILFSGIKPSIFDICCSQSSIFVFRYYQGITNKSHSICLVLKQDLFQKANSHHSSIIVPYVRHVWKHNSHTHIHKYIYIYIYNINIYHADNIHSVRDSESFP